MNHFVEIIIEFNVVITLFYLFYRVLFRNDSNFSLRRFFLIGSVFTALLIALLNIRVASGTGALFFGGVIQDVVVRAGSTATAGQQEFSVFSLLVLIYAMITLGFLVRLFALLGYLIFQIITSKRQKRDGLILVENKKLHASSFFHVVFLDRESSDPHELDHILEHERNHARSLHSLDRLVLEFTLAICWFNPFAWLFRKAVIENHEYQADSGVIAAGADAFRYQMSILNQYIGSASLSNQFSSHIKNRIIMLNKNYKQGGSWKGLLLLPPGLLLFFAISCNNEEPMPVIDEPESETVTIKKENNSNIAEEGGEELFFIVEEMPTFNGGDAAVEFRKYIAENLEYPEKAARNGIAGKVIIQFVVNPSGEVTNVTVVRGVDSSLDREAVRVVESSPDWTPGKQKGKKVGVVFTFPITFALK
mgnify:CR=1 FL=1